MRKTLTVIATVALSIMFTSSYNSYDVDIDIDSFAPNFEIAKPGNRIKLSEKRGNFIVVNFWKSTAAESRIRNIEYDRFFKSANKETCYIAINYDNSKRLYDELAKVDRLTKVSQFYDAGGLDSEVYKSYHLDEGMNSYLLDKTGKILAVNPTTQQLTKYFCQ